MGFIPLNGMPEVMVEKELSEWVEKKLKQRLEARTAGNYALSDQIRSELAAKGIQVQDTPDGQIWRPLRKV